MKLEAILLLLALPILSLAKGSKEDIHVSKTFSITPNGTVEIINKYGTLHINTWDKDSVNFEISFHISEKNPAQLERIKENVNFQFHGDETYRKCATVFDNSYSTSSFLKDIKERTNISGGESFNSKINMTVTVPSSVKLTIDYKYGNINIPNHDGNIKLTLSNGKFQGFNLNGSNDFNLSYGRAQIAHVNQMSLNLNYSDLEIREVNTLNLSSKSSDIKIDKASLVNFTSARGKLSFMDIDNVFGSSQFSELTIMQLNKSTALKMDYGTLSQLNLNSTSKRVDLDCTNTPIQIKLDPAKAYTFDITAQKSPIKTKQNIKWKESQEENTNIIQRTGSKQGNKEATDIDIKSKNSKINID